MSDQGFDFGPPPPRREAKPFEPPPWEREQFERLAKERAEQAAAETAAAARATEEQEASPDKPAGTAPDQSSAAAHGTMGPNEAAVTAPGVALNKAAEPAPGSAMEDDAIVGPEDQVDDTQIEVMLIGLKAEEPPALAGVWVVSLVSAFIVGSVGIALVIWSVVAFSNSGGGFLGAMIGAILLLFGVGFVSVAAWLGHRTLRQRGVL